MTFLAWLSDPFKGLSDLQLGDEQVTLNHLVEALSPDRRGFGRSVFLLFAGPCYMNLPPPPKKKRMGDETENGILQKNIPCKSQRRRLLNLLHSGT